MKQGVGNRRTAGFSLIELISVLVILGILAAIALPRFFDLGAFNARGFSDEVIAALRYGQKVAVAQRRFVCAGFTTNSITLTIGATTACGSDLTTPAGGTPYTIAAPASSGITFTATPFYFDALGKPSLNTIQTITINGINIVIEPETGYVHSP